MTEPARREAFKELYVRLQYDGKDLQSVVEIFYYGEEGQEVVHEAATNACFNIDTCADMADDLEPTLKGRIDPHLEGLGIFVPPPLLHL